jgi:hypothetical protein
MAFALNRSETTGELELTVNVAGGSVRKSKDDDKVNHQAVDDHDRQGTQQFKEEGAPHGGKGCRTFFPQSFYSRTMWDG